MRPSITVGSRGSASGPWSACVLAAVLLLLPGPAGAALAGSPRMSASSAGTGPNVAQPLDWAASLSPGLGVNLSVAFGAELTVPSQPAYLGTTTARSIGLNTTGTATVGVVGFGVNESIGVPAFGNATAVPIPGASQTVGGIPFQVYLAVHTEVDASVVVSGPSPATTNLSWNASGGQDLWIAAPPTPTASGGLSVDFSGISMTLVANLSATGTVPVLGRSTVPIGSPVRLASVPGRPATFSVQIPLGAPIEIASVGPDPQSVSPGAAYSIVVRATGGVGPLTYDYVQLPPGCASANRSELGCVAPGVGAYRIEVAVHDSVGDTASDAGWLNVSTAPATSAGLGSLLGGFWPPALLGAAIVAVGVGTALVVRRRRRRAGR